jgi:hypothetical protein
MLTPILCCTFLFWRTAKNFPQFMSPKSQIQLLLKTSSQLEFFSTIYIKHAILHCKIWMIFCFDLLYVTNYFVSSNFLKTNQIWTASISNNRIKCVEIYIHVIYSKCVLTSKLFSIRNRQYNLFYFTFRDFFKLVWWFLWIKYNLEKNTLPGVLVKCTTKFYVCCAFSGGSRQSFKKI